jgi:serine O-acetyltransferase
MSAWRADLAACDRRGTLGQAIVAWFANPGFVLACHYRVAHWAAGRGAAGRVIAVLIERRMLRGFACQISSMARIGPGLRLPHPLGIVLGRGVVIGAGATLYQGVTLGRRSAGEGLYPRLGDGVTVYCDAKLVGAVTLGDGARVGIGEVVIGKPQRLTRDVVGVDERRESGGQAPRR